jgi:hypothetical protein
MLLHDRLAYALLQQQTARALLHIISSKLLLLLLLNQNVPRQGLLDSQPVLNGGSDGNIGLFF